MLKRGYAPTLALGTIAASGTLGQIIPPSVILVLLASVLNVPVGTLFVAAIVPGSCLVLFYALYVIVYAQIFPNRAPAMPKEEVASFRAIGFSKEVIQSFLLPLLLIVMVLGTIIGGIASPTEAAGVGAMGAILLTLYKRKLTIKILSEVTKETIMLTSMVFMILIGATAFSLVFRGLEGDKMFLQIVSESQLGPDGFLLLVMALVFIAGFFIDFIEIIFIVVPVVAPIFASMGIDLVWIGILLAINLQTSFLTPPFGFALFYLKGVAPPEIKTKQLYLGVLPFVFIQIVFLTLLILFPGLLKLF